MKHQQNKSDIIIPKFLIFLEDLLKEPIQDVYRFSKGSSSYNFKIKTSRRTILVKLLKKHSKLGFERIYQIMNRLEKNPDLKYAHLQKLNGEPYFVYQNYYGIILDYIQGEALSSYEITRRHFRQILHLYALFQKTNFSNCQALLPPYDLEKIWKDAFVSLQEQENQIKTHNGFQKIIFQRLVSLIKKYLLQLQNEPLQRNPNRTTIIHGDFHNNNLLFQKEKLVALIDFEEVGYGYPTEDLMRFILCLIERLPIWITPQSYVGEWIELSQKRFSFTQEEWLLGLNSFSVQKVQKILRGKYKFFSLKHLKKMIQLIFYFHLHKKIAALIKEKIK